MKILSIEAAVFQLPRRRNFKWAGLNGELGRFVLVQVRTEDGLTGYGEATALPDWGGDAGRRGGESSATVVHLVNDIFAPALQGHDATAITAAHQIMDRLVVGNSYAKCAVDIALYDILGKVVGLPVYRLLGGAARPAVSIAHMVGLLPEIQAIDEAVGAIGDGVGALQIKGGVDAVRDVSLIRALRRELGQAVTLRLDANQGYGGAREAQRVVGQLAEAGVSLVEQPAVGMAHMAEVTRTARVPVVADESCWDAADAMDLANQRGADCISIYLAKAGGFAAAAAVAAIAEARQIRCDINGSIESAVGNAANLHFAMATPSVNLACVIPVSAPAGRHPWSIAGRYYEDDIVREPFPVRDGALLPLDAPGLGIDVDEAALARYRCT